MGSHLSLLISATMLSATLVYYYKMVLLTEMTTEASLFNTLYAEYATPQMMDSLRAVEEFSLESDVTPEQIVCRAHGDALWERKFDYDWQRLLHWYRKLVYFHRMGLLNDRFFQEFPGVSRTREFIGHVEPFALGSCQLYQESNCSEVFDYLRELYDLPKRQAITCPGQEKTTTEGTADAVAKEEL
ncbi:hypothetical protein PRIC1_008575 [Phytophthora ramorum]|uniref:Uncharacterized protein n=1 Tax=Phytophthora ramorum TaxID=164328 RepID=H3GHT4_PHYRM|nr:hypothetical protein KRP23_6658 [Phytophthora ramorum]KAH7500997.1 hypothetical protein KRP22_10238 [Phytophthora ramorum]KAH7505569.1 hypothetical protein KRP22_6039 [Phytophthora ramorum]